MIHSAETYTLHHYLCWHVTAQFLSFDALPCGPTCTSEIRGAVLAKLRFSFLKLQPGRLMFPVSIYVISSVFNYSFFPVSAVILPPPLFFCKARVCLNP